MKPLPLASSREVRLWIWFMIRENKREFSGLLGLFCLVAISGLFGPQILGHVVNSASNGTDTSHIDLLAAFFVITLVIRGILKWFAETRARILGERVLAETRRATVAHALALPLGTIEDAGTGDLLSRVTSNIDDIDNMVRVGAPQILIAIVSFIFTAVAMVATSPLLALGFLVSLPLLVLSTVRYLRRNPAAMMRDAECVSIIQADLYETAEGAHTVEALGLADKRIRSNQRALEDHVIYGRLQRRIAVVHLPCATLSYAIPIAAILLLGGWAYLHHWVDLGVITTMLLYAQMLIGPLNEALTRLARMLNNQVSLRRILGVRAKTVTEVHHGDPPQSRDITIHYLRFGYSADRDVLHGIELRIPQGERLAIVGPSGSGKSTLGRLLAGIAVPTSGSVRVGDLEVSSLASDVLRKEILLLTQEHHIFAGTLRENLTLPAGQWTDDELLSALNSVGAGPWLSCLETGLDTELGSGAYSVPAGIAQRLALARVLLADPHTIVLDEAMSLLDFSSARDLERSLNQVLAGRTVISIAHRLHTAAAADRVLVMEEGRISELGSPKELLNAGGAYARLVCSSTAHSSTVTPRP